MSQADSAGPFRLFDTDGETVAEITTDGSTLKPFVNAVREVAGECRVHFAPEGIHVAVVDAANVFMIDTHLSASAFERYELHETHTVGVSLKSFRHLIRRARMGHDDTLNLRVHERRMYASVSRGYDDDLQIITDDAIDGIDPDSCRDGPDTETFADLDWTPLDLGVEPFADVVTHVTKTSDHTRIGLDAGDLVVSAETDTMGSEARIPDAAPVDADAEAIYSNAYVTDIPTILSKAKADTVTLSVGENIPLRVAFDRHRDGEPIFGGELYLAPRKTTDGPEGDA